MTSVKPISPDEISIALPDFVIQGINAAIVDKYRGGIFYILQEEIVESILKVAPEGITKKIIYEKNYLDFIKLYVSYGWHIVQDRPGYNESYKTNYTFSKAK